MHNAAFAALGLNWCYMPFSVQPGRVEAAVQGLVALGFRGANVTVPHKQAVMPPLSTVASNAQELGAVNTIVIDRAEDANGSAESAAVTLAGYNTDDVGFIQSLVHAGFELKGHPAIHVVVAGAGGAARAVVFGLLKAGVARITVLNRTLERAQTLVESMRPFAQQPEQVRAWSLTSEKLIESARVADLLVNATSVGMWPHVNASIWPDGVSIPAHLHVFDLVYNPLETKLLRQARGAGAKAIDGLEMLVRQGGIAFELWTGQEPPLDVMRTACAQRLRP
jgi:shikimate dehydrogenase